MKKAVLVLLFVVLFALILSSCGSGESTSPGGSEAGGTSINEPTAQAEAAARAANRRAISAAAQQYRAMEGKAAASIQELVPKYLQTVPGCPSGGTYTLSGDRVVCSVHGS